MGLNRFDVIRQINLYSSEDNQEALIDLLCEILDDEEFKTKNLDLIEIIISIGELYGYYSYIENFGKTFGYSEAIRKNMYKSSDGKIYYNSGQLSLLNEIKNENKLFISAPTTFGKTKLVLDYILLEENNFNNILFLIPTNSLSEEIYIKLLNFNHIHNFNYHITTNPKILGNKNILILTPEKYLLLLESKDIDFDLYIMDESYKIEEEDKNIDYDDPLNSRSSKFRRTMDIIASKQGKTIYLSPFTYISDDSMNRFFDKYNVKKINRKDKYVSKKLYKIADSSDFKTINSTATGFLKTMSGVDKSLFIVKELLDSTIVYVRYPKDALDFVNKYKPNYKKEDISDRFKKFMKHIEDNYEFEGSKWYILEGLKKGIGVYVAPMPRYIKREVVRLFNDGELKILVVTSAFAEGVNSSAKNIIITNDVVGSNVKMTSLDLLNLSGRAGRFGVHSKGNIFSVKDDIYDRLVDCIDSGVKISNSNYENGKNGNDRALYDIEKIDKNYLSINELDKRNLVEAIQNSYNLSDLDLNIALSISNYDKIRLYDFFMKNSTDNLINTRNEIINNLLKNEKKDVVVSMKFIFDELVNAGIKISKEKGDLPPYSKNNEFLWGKFYSIHSSGNVKEILRRRKKYIEERYNLEKNSFENSKSWIDEYITDGKVDDFKLYNQAFRFISNIIEYRIPFYVGFYVSIFKLYCKKNIENIDSSYDIIEISNNLENKNIDEKYDDLLEFGFSIDTIKKIQISNGDVNLLDDYEKIIYKEYKALV